MYIFLYFSDTNRAGSSCKEYGLPTATSINAAAAASKITYSRSPQFSSSKDDLFATEV